MPHTGLRVSTAFAVALCASVLAHVAWHAAPSVFATWDARLSDRFIEWRNHRRLGPSVDPRIAIIELSDKATRQLGRTPDRGDLASLARRLHDLGVSVQAYDFKFDPISEGAHDQALLDAFRSSGNVVAGTALSVASADRTERDNGLSPSFEWTIRVKGSAGRLPSIDVATPVLAGLPGVAQIAALNVRSDEDGVYRRLPLLYRVGTSERFVPTLALRVVADVLRVGPEAFELEPGVALRIHGARAIETGASEIAIPVDATGAMRINYAGDWTTFDHYQISQFVSPRGDAMPDRGELDEAVAIVADTSTGRADVAATPVDEALPRAALHAGVVNSVLTRTFLSDASAIAVWTAEILLVLGLTAILAFLRWHAAAAAMAALVGTYVAGVLFALVRLHVVFPALRPLLSAASVTVALLLVRYGSEQRARLLLRRSFSAYFSPEIIAKLERDRRFLDRPAVRRPLTILFSDIRGFTHRSSSMAPEQVHALLTDYFGEMVRIVFAHGGTVDKFIGDGLMAFWNDPVEQDDHAERAVRAASEMQKVMRANNRAWSDGTEPMTIRIGINTGVAVVGNMGSRRRLSYTAIGSAVNLAQRLESNAPPGGILIAAATRDALPVTIRVEPHGEIAVKGLDAPVDTYLVVQNAS